jgi:hypothetical protein
MNFIIVTLAAVLIMTLIFSFRKLTGIPLHWNQQMVFRYSDSHGLSGESAHYDFYNDSIHVHTRETRNGDLTEVRYKATLAPADLDLLLATLRENSIDRIRVYNTYNIVYDGASFSMQLIHKDKFIINLSNSAYEELRSKDRQRFQKVVNHIREMAKSAKSSN